MAQSDDTRELLDELSKMGSRGRAEREPEDSFTRTIYPVAEHIRAFDPDVTIVLGPRGAGKTELFRAVMEQDLLAALQRQAGTVRLRVPENPAWIPAHPIGSGFPDALGMAQFYKLRGDDPQAGIRLWFAYLTRVLQGEFDSDGKTALHDLLRRQGGAAVDNHDAFRTAADAPLLAIDRLDAELLRKNRYVFLGYDELDTLGGPDHVTQSRAITDLIAFWASYTRRWQRIRAKIFLRTDLFDRHARIGGADLAKLAANRTEITWSDRNLYGLLLKRIVNQSEKLREYCGNKIELTYDEQLGWIPRINRPKDAQPIIERMMGQYMGVNAKKGLSFRWLLEHIRDGTGQALPRPLVRLVEEAADKQLHSGELPRWPRLLSPSYLRRALDTVSREHVESCRDEWRWLDGLKQRVEGRNVPIERKELEHGLAAQWDTPAWGDASQTAVEEVRPPVDSPRKFVDYLLEVGIFRARSEGRIDAPDLYLEGLGLKRTGGVRR